MSDPSNQKEITNLIRILNKAAAGDYTVRSGSVTETSDMKPLTDAVNRFLEHVDTAYQECKRIELSLRESEARFRSLFEDSTLGIYRTTPQGTILLVNSAALRMLGYNSLEELSRRNLEETGFEPAYPREEFKKRLDREGVIIGLESAWLRKDGSTIYIRESAQAIKDADGNICYYDGTFEDITERKLAEERIGKELKEKEILLKEIHHRVKNNLQIICSLLNLQAQKVKDEEAKKAFQYSKQRIFSMSLVHEQLYRSSDFSQIQMKQYIDQLIRELDHAYHISSKIKIQSNIEDVRLSIEVAIPCGLILNELLTNAIKHAFPNQNEGKITVSLVRSGNLNELRVVDNGVGMPKSVHFEKTKSLGLNMVKVLVHQLGGDLKLKKRSGTIFIIQF